MTKFSEIDFFNYRFFLDLNRRLLYTFNPNVTLEPVCTLYY
jgi:hypothetical protein